VEHEKKRFNEANFDLTSTAIKVNKIMAAMMPIMMVVLNLTTVAILWFGGIRISNGHMQVGDMMAFIQYAMQIMFSFIMLSMMFVMIPRASVSGVRINEVLETVADIKNPVVSTIGEGKKGLVEFQNVTFSYPGAEMPAISNISFSMKPGEVTAIIGGTGSGKSTLINLIPRFYDVDRGKVLVDGVDVREMTQESLREKIGFVPQMAVLFTGTISENIRFGKEDATDDEIQHAAKIAQASEFILNMPDGFDAIIAQGGTNVSGGQKQRLSIARALVRRPEIYIFDDSFSALDFKTDAKLRAALKEETLDSTVLIVAQRVSTIMDADQIIVLDNGEIAGIGKHRELMERSAVYREIVMSQLSEEEIA
jgi:ATP-binding cassette subfamily B protein